MRAQAPAWALIAWLSAVLAALGAVVASLGPLLPELAAATGARLEHTGLVISALFGGTLVAQALSAVLIERFGTRAVVGLSLGACALGCAGLAGATSLPTLLLAGGVVGVGYGCGSVGINLLASRLVPARPGLVLNICNACYGIGAVAGPLVSSALLREGGEARGIFLAGSVVLAALAPLALALPLGSTRTASTASTRVHRPSLLMLAMLMALGGGIEAGVGGWLATYVQQTLALSPAEAAVRASMFWASYLGGRMLVTAVSMRVGPEPLLALTVACMGAGTLVLAGATSLYAGTTLGIAMVGAATGPIYPLTFAVVTRQFPAQATRAAAAVATSGGVGATALPWVMGLALPLWHGRGMPAMAVVLAAGMAAALYANRALEAARRQAASGPPG